MVFITNSAIFYFSGTGNSLKVAKDIKGELKNIDLISIPKVIKEEKIEVNGEYLAIVFPVYVWGLPLIVDEFIKKLNIGKNTYIFAVATMGGSSGNALKQVNDLIEMKDRSLMAGFEVAMPSNYIPLSGAKSQEKQNKLFNEEKMEIDKIAKVVKEKRNYGYKRSNVIVEKVLVPLMYKNINKLRVADKKYWVKDTCTSCGLCEKVCQVNNIEMKNGKPTWKNKCEQCMACLQYCPHEAIEYGKKSVGRKRYKNPDISLKELMDGSIDK